MLKSGTPQPPKLKLLRPLQLQLATGSLPERSHRRGETCNSLLPSNRRRRWPPSVPLSQAAERLPRVRAVRFFWWMASGKDLQRLFIFQHLLLVVGPAGTAPLQICSRGNAVWPLSTRRTRSNVTLRYVSCVA